jgi:hypothetical protein
MPLRKKTALPRPAAAHAVEKSLRVRVKALEIPPIKDGLIIGRDAAIGGDAMLRTLKLMTNEKFERLTVNDDIVQDLIVRTSILRKLGEARLLKFVLERVRPLMSENELLMLDMEVELILEDSH